MSSTPIRAVRVPDALWKAAQGQAAKDGTTITAVLVKALTDYVEPAED